MNKHILVFYDHFYPAYKAGGPVQSLVNLVRELYKQYDFYIVCKPHEMNETEILQGVAINEWNNWEDKAQVLYRNYTTQSKLKLKQILAAVRPDVIFINGLFSLHFNILPLYEAIHYSKKQSGCKIILSARGMLHPGALSQKGLKKQLFLKLFKRLGWHQQVIWHATDEQEIKYIQQQFGKSVQAEVAGNFPNFLPVISSTSKKENELIMGTVALISPMKNHLEVLKALQFIKGKISWHIYGPVKDEAYWQLCKQLIQQLPSHISVHYHGELPPVELSKTMSTFQLFIMPSKSENFGHAILEALSAGKPVITTDTTPFKNLKEEHAGITVSTKNLPEELVKAIDYFSNMNEDKFSTVENNAAIFARKFISIDLLYQQYQYLFTTT